MRELHKVSVVWKDGYVFVVYRHKGINYVVGGGNANSKEQNGIWLGQEVKKTLNKFGVDYENRETDNRQD